MQDRLEKDWSQGTWGEEQFRYERMGTGKQRKEGPFLLKERSVGFGHQLDAGRKGDGGIELGSRSSGTDTRGWCLPDQRERCQMLN